MTYATDGKCHNANRGTYGHECGKPATWVGMSPNGFESGYCDDCKEHGDEGKECLSWFPFPQQGPIRPRRLVCCICGNDAGRWQQHWNRDTGYGVCAKCVAWERSRGETEQVIASYYGKEGINWGQEA